MNYEGRTRWKGHQDRQLVRIDSFVLKWSTKKVMISICQNRSFLRTGTSFITILIAVRRLKFIWCEISKLSWSKFSTRKRKSEAVYIQRNILGLRLWVEHRTYVKTFNLIAWEVWNPSLVNELQNHKKWIESNWFELKPNLSQTRSSRLFIRNWRMEKTRFD